jgi:hypothetical protein
MTTANVTPVTSQTITLYSARMITAHETTPCQICTHHASVGWDRGSAWTLGASAGGWRREAGTQRCGCGG